ncbi:YckD family protein [Tenuibacillus multivorans]|uniref:DUF2680 domain-containing protein n=1 Tax=Tenuibacillus multivorans TaxID=237069 RepID=A0A1H0FJA1_9BACI|nr:YckD family protein [Tenuibacillus multivorans]GEL77688.1 hypothetical protein TMU01_19230 [Tenuibacillus multivorans]SDN94694.1 Protein of unknown function [Tenuibacillus multivorans]
MRKFWLSIMSVMLTVSVLGIAALNVGAESVNKDVKLSEEQVNEMSSLQQEAFDQRKAIINKYVEYGVFSEEKGEKMISHLEERYTKLEANGFIPKWDKKHKKHKRDDS